MIDNRFIPNTVNSGEFEDERVSSYIPQYVEGYDEDDDYDEYCVDISDDDEEDTGYYLTTNDD